MNPVFRVCGALFAPYAAMNSSLVLLLDSDDPNLREQIRHIAPDLEIVAPTDENALRRAHITYGGVDKKTDLSGAQNLRWIQVGSAGVNGWPMEQLKARDIRLTTASGIHAQPIAEHMFGLLLMKTRALDKALLAQPKHSWRGDDFGGQATRIAGKTLGLLGVGSIGQHAARVGAAFGMRVVGLRRSGEDSPNVEAMFTPDNRLDFFAQCDVVMNTLPLTDDSRDFMGRAEFEALPAGAIVINTGRGATIDTEAMLDWLRRDEANLALLDVTEPEPLPTDHPLWELPNVLITSHYSGSHPDYNERANEIFLDNLRRFLNDEPLHNLVDADAGY